MISLPSLARAGRVKSRNGARVCSRVNNASATVVLADMRISDVPINSCGWNPVVRCTRSDAKVRLPSTSVSQIQSETRRTMSLIRSREAAISRM